MKQTVDVAACIVRSDDGKVLLAERGARQVSAGYWEIPGGKIDPGETPAAAAARELHEEVGLEASDLQPWIAYDYEFPTKRIRLHFFVAKRWTGKPHGREGQRIAWVDPARSSVAPILPSNDRIFRALGLPREFLTFDVGSASLDRTLDALSSAFASGTRFARLRAPAVGTEQRSAFARRAAERARPFGALVSLEGTPLEARRAGVSAYTAAGALPTTVTRPDVALWIAGCRTARDVDVASRLGADVIALEEGSDAAAISVQFESLARPVYAPAKIDSRAGQLLRLNAPSGV